MHLTLVWNTFVFKTLFCFVTPNSPIRPEVMMVLRHLLQKMFFLQTCERWYQDRLSKTHQKFFLVCSQLVSGNRIQKLSSQVDLPAGVHCLLIHPLIRSRSTRWRERAASSSVRNGSAIIAHYGLSNAKPLIIDLILWLPEMNFRLRNTTEPR